MIFVSLGGSSEPRYSRRNVRRPRRFRWGKFYYRAVPLWDAMAVWLKKRPRRRDSLVKSGTLVDPRRLFLRVRAARDAEKAFLVHFCPFD